jgi:predicted nucleic-acid-binding protein
MQSLHDGDLILLLDPVTLAEVVFVMSSVYDVSNADIAHALVPLLQQPGLRLEEKDRYLQALYLFAGPVRHFGDACACATALLESSGKLLSFDRKLSRVEGIQREEGFPAP